MLLQSVATNEGYTELWEHHRLSIPGIFQTDGLIGKVTCISDPKVLGF
ncbi:hypothetical protein HSBAA_26940 [Vreelandella sulfidaeris]|uniref:Uncharacterized protein n=1 Tax=Vreelandella sulfidaeris TaxID=115553 RepID=A0A455UAR8_9GAMM|nr:hypothetical protein HSBAA_26940 [Halomonas sulfidaeris]